MIFFPHETCNYLLKNVHYTCYSIIIIKVKFWIWSFLYYTFIVILTVYVWQGITEFASFCNQLILAPRSKLAYESDKCLKYILNLKAHLLANCWTPSLLRIIVQNIVSDAHIRCTTYGTNSKGYVV